MVEGDKQKKQKKKKPQIEMYVIVKKIANVVQL